MAVPPKVIGPFTLGKGIPTLVTFGMSSIEAGHSLGKFRTYGDITGRSLSAFSEDPGRYYDSLCGWVKTVNEAVYRVNFYFDGYHHRLSGPYRLLITNDQESISFSYGLTEAEFVEHCEKDMRRTGFSVKYDYKGHKHYINRDHTCYVKFERGVLTAVECVAMFYPFP